jgi:two-component system NarL family response regulator
LLWRNDAGAIINHYWFPRSRSELNRNRAVKERERMDDIQKARVRIALADSDPATLVEVAAILEPRFDIVAQAENAHELLDAVESLSPSVAILDIDLPDMDGIETTRLITANYPDVKVLVLSIHDLPEIVDAVFEAGASGYVSKFVAYFELIPAIESILIGRRRYRATGPGWSS